MQPAPSSRVVGLGVRVERDKGPGQADSGKWRVRAIVPGFGADRSGLVKVGDIVEAIDKRALDRVTEEELVQLMCGLPGSTCSLRLIRGGDSAGIGGNLVSVRVKRVDPVTNVLEEEERDRLPVNYWVRRGGFRS